MFESPVKIADLIRWGLFALVVVAIVFLSSFFDARTKIVFCNVGQGDATYIRLDNRFDILVDAGPDQSVLTCLGKFMPFWDKEIELAFLSHPNIDHFGGYSFIAGRYKIDRLITVKGLIFPKTYQELLRRLAENNILTEYSTNGDQILFNSIFSLYSNKISILWPDVDFKSTTDNDYSMVLLLEKNDFRLLFTGDASPFVLGRLSHGAVNKVNILKVPHHGSKNGLTETFLDLADPNTAVISVGKNNSYGHPNKEVLDMLKAKNIDIRRTDLEGDIVFTLPE